MQSVIYAATSHGYCVQVIDGGEVVYEYRAGNHQRESQTHVDPRSSNAVKLRQLKRWAKQTAGEVAKQRGIPTNRIAFDPDLEVQLKEQDEERTDG